MRILHDYEGRSVRLTDERLAHIREHPEMIDMEDEIEQTLRAPEHVVESLPDAETRLYYRFYFGTPVGGKFLCVVVKAGEGEAFVLTAYLTNSVKKGRQIWPRTR